MAVAFVNIASANTGAAGTSLACNVPGSTANGDVMIAALSCYDNPGTITFTGWTFIRSDTQATPGTRCYLYYRVASSEPASYTPSWTNSVEVVLTIATYSGVNTTSPIEAHTGRGQTSTVSVTANGVSSGKGSKALVTVHSIRGNAAGRTFTEPAGMTERNDRNSGLTSSDVGQEFCDEIITGSGAATGTRVATASGTTTNSSNVGQAILLAADPGIRYIGSAGGVTTATLPSGWAPGDVAVVFAFNDGGTIMPSIPGTFTAYQQSAVAIASSRIGYRILQAGDTDIGTWTNATGVVVVVYRGADATAPLGAFAHTTGNSGSITYPALATPNVTDGSSWIVAVGGHRSANTDIENNPAGMINRADHVGASEEVAHDSNGGLAAYAGGSSGGGGSSSNWNSFTFEVLLAAVAGGAGGARSFTVIVG